MADQQSKRQSESRAQTESQTESKSQGDSQSMATRASEGDRSLAMRQFQDPLSLFDWVFDRMQRDLFGTSLFNAMLSGQAGEGNGGGPARVPRIQVRDTGDAIVLTAEMPGIDPQDIQVEFGDEVLTIRGESEIQEESDGEQVVRYVSFYRQMRLPDDVDVDQAEASYRNGVLSIRFPKRVERSNVKQIPVSTQESSQQTQQQAQPQAKNKAA